MFDLFIYQLWYDDCVYVLCFFWILILIEFRHFIVIIIYLLREDDEIWDYTKPTYWIQSIL